MNSGRASNVVKCPTNCEHDYYFPHSVITHRREFLEDGIRYAEVSQFIVCRACAHWIAGTDSAECRCRFKCHEEPGGTYIDKRSLDAVN